MHRTSLNADFGELIVFTRVVEPNGFTAAARELNMPKSTVSRKVAELEARLGARLLQRTTRRVTLTDVGRTYYESCLRVLEELQAGMESVAMTQGEPRGQLRVAAPFTFSILGPILAEFLTLHPKVRIELVCSDRNVDLIEERFDLAIRIGSNADSSLIARKLGVLRRCIFGSAKLVDEAGCLEHPSELATQPCAIFAAAGNTWALQAGNQRATLEVQPRLIVNDYDTLRTAVRAGFGFGLLPEYQCLNDLETGQLKRVLTPWSVADAPVHALYPSRRHMPPKLTALLDFLNERLSQAL